MGCDVLTWAALLAPGPEIPVFCRYARDLRYRGPAIAADCRAVPAAAGRRVRGALRRLCREGLLQPERIPEPRVGHPRPGLAPRARAANDFAAPLLRRRRRRKKGEGPRPP